MPAFRPSVAARLAAVALVLVGIAPAPAQVDSGMMEASIRARQLSMALLTYAQAHDGRLPPDMAATVPLLSDAPKPDLPKVFRDQFLTALDAGVKIPADAGPEWVNEHSSFIYLAGGGVKTDEIASWADTVVAHQRLERPFPSDPTPDNPEGGMVVLTYFDGHTSVMTRAAARAAVDESVRAFTAMRTGADYPDGQQAVWDLRAIAAGIKGYTKANTGHLPATLGDTLAFLPEHPKRLATGAQRARVYLSPRAKKNSHAPDNPTPDWVNQHSSYVYLGSADLHLSEVEDQQRLVVVHARVDDAVSVGHPPRELVPLLTFIGGADLREREYAEAMIAETKAVLDAQRNGRPLPEYQATLRDLRLIGEAVKAYEKDQKSLPPDIGSTLAYLPVESMKDASLEALARVYLSPRDERSRGPVTEAVTPDWITKHSSYTYLGRAGITLRDCGREGIQTLVHANPAQPFEVLHPGQKVELIPCWGPFGAVWLVSGAEDEGIKEATDALKTLTHQEPKAAGK
jgi:hypothetical protein